MLPSRISITPVPRLASGWVDLARRAITAGRLGEAIEALRKAVAAEPGNASIHTELGQTLLLAGRPREALDPLRRAVARDPRFATGHLRLGMAIGRPRTRPAPRRLMNRPRRCSRRWPKPTTSLDFCTRTTVGRSRRWCASGAPRTRPRRSTCGRWRKPGRWSSRAMRKARRPSCARSLGRQPRNGAALALLGDVLARLGQFAEAETHFEASLAVRPHLVETFYEIVRGRRITVDDTDLIRRMDAALQRPDLDDLRLSMLELARGKAFEDLGWYDKAMASFDAASKARARAVPFDIEPFTRGVDSLIATFDAETLARAHAGASADPTPVLVLGMPRSGTTLCEHVLCSHPDVVGPGEVDFWTTAGPTLAKSGPGVSTGSSSPMRRPSICATCVATRARRCGSSTRRR